MLKYYPPSCVVETRFESQDMGCRDAYDAVIDACPAEIFDPQSSECDVEGITDECVRVSEQLEGWYCSCKSQFEYIEGSDAPLLMEMNETQKQNCLKYHRIFTHNSCIALARDREPGLLPISINIEFSTHTHITHLFNQSTHVSVLNAIFRKYNFRVSTCQRDITRIVEFGKTLLQDYYSQCYSRTMFPLVLYDDSYNVSYPENASSTLGPFSKSTSESRQGKMNLKTTAVNRVVQARK